MPLVELARHPARLWEWAQLPPYEAARKLALLPGVGPWTVGTVMATAMGDPDAVAVGDYHLKNVVGYALAGRAGATDGRMLELLSPYAGQRGRGRACPAAQRSSCSEIRSVSADPADVAGR